MIEQSQTPLTPSDCDLRDFPFMQLDVVRLRDSDIAALSTGEEFRSAVLLWCASWHQVPAASLPDDDKILAHLAGFGRSLNDWMQVKNGALRGWIKCDDGRLYHPVIAEKANEALIGKSKYSDKKEADRLRLAEKREAEKQLKRLKELEEKTCRSYSNKKEKTQEEMCSNLSKIHNSDDENMSQNVAATNTNVAATFCDVATKKEKEKEKENKEKEKEKEKTILPFWLSDETWNSFVNHRKSIKSPLSDHAKNLILEKLSKLRDDGNDHILVINQSIENGWKGLFPVNDNDLKIKKSTGDPPVLSIHGQQTANNVHLAKSLIFGVKNNG